MLFTATACNKSNKKEYILSKNRIQTDQAALEFG